MTKPSRKSNGTATAEKIVQLYRDATSLREEVASLQRQLKEAHKNGSGGQADLLVEANEQLVLAALDAETTAERAVLNLDELTRTSQCDALTGTPNRALMLDRLEIAMALAHRHRTRVAVLFIDLDDFKQINDTLGHGVGDSVLQLVAHRLESAVRHSDTVSRHSGDEFLVLLAEMTNESGADVVAAKIQASLAAPSCVAGHEIQLSASVGISIYPEDGTDAATLIRRADAAMYHSKRRGRGGVALFADVMRLA